MYSNRSIDSSFRFSFTIPFLVFFPIDILWDHLFDMLFIIVNPRVGGYREFALMRNYNQTVTNWFYLCSLVSLVLVGSNRIFNWLKNQLVRR